MIRIIKIIFVLLFTVVLASCQKVSIEFGQPQTNNPTHKSLKKNYDIDQEVQFLFVKNTIDIINKNINQTTLKNNQENSLNPIILKNETARKIVLKQFPELEKEAEDFRKNYTQDNNGDIQLNTFYQSTCILPHEKIQDFIVGQKILVEWGARYPNSPTPVLMYINYLDCFAWDIRGPQSTKEVPQEKMEVFAKTIAEEVKVLNLNKNVAKNDPQWYFDMVRAYQQIGSPETRNSIIMLSQEAYQKFPEYYPIYQIGIKSQSQPWGGSSEEIQDYIHIFASDPTTNKKDLIMLTKLYQGVGDCWCKNTPKILNDIGFSWRWNLVKQGWEQIEQSSPISANYAYEAKFAFFAEDWLTFLSLQDKINSENYDILGGKESLDDMVKWAKKSSQELK